MKSIHSYLRCKRVRLCKILQWIREIKLTHTCLNINIITSQKTWSKLHYIRSVWYSYTQH
jgi:hypothetical protein